MMCDPEAQEQIKFLAAIIAEWNSGEPEPSDNPDYWMALAKDKTARDRFYNNQKTLGKVKQAEL